MVRTRFLLSDEGQLMILQQQSDPMVAIRQTDHAFLAGFFAREYGNEVFQRPEPFDSFCLAAAEHDNGWQEWELEPGVDQKSFTPHTFMTIPTDEHIALYQRGTTRVWGLISGCIALAASATCQAFTPTRTPSTGPISAGLSLAAAGVMVNSSFGV